MAGESTVDIFFISFNPRIFLILISTNREWWPYNQIPHKNLKFPLFIVVK